MAKQRIAMFGWSHSVHVQRWVRGLTARGYDIKLISLGGQRLDCCETVLLPPGNRWSYLRLAGRAVAEAQAFKPDIVHGHYVTGNGFWTVRTGIRPSVVSVWGSDIAGLGGRSPLKRLLVRSVLRRATHITATSQYLKHTVGQFDPSLRGKISVVSFGVTVPEQIAEPPEAPPVRFCYLKKLEAIYGPDVLLRAFALARQEAPEIRLTIAGEGEMKAKLLWETANLGIDDIVEFVGWIPNEQIYEFVQAHHVMVMPSVVPEGFGVAALEASVCRRPVLASWAGGIPEVVRREETGILVPPQDVEKLSEGIVRLARDSEARRRFGENGRIFATEYYDWERSLDDMAGLYERLTHANAKK